MMMIAERRNKMSNYPEGHEERWVNERIASSGMETESLYSELASDTYLSNQRFVPVRDDGICRDTSNSSVLCGCVACNELRACATAEWSAESVLGTRRETTPESSIPESRPTAPGPNLECGETLDEDAVPTLRRSPSMSPPEQLSERLPTAHLLRTYDIIEELRRSVRSLRGDRHEFVPECVFCTVRQVLANLVCADSAIQDCMRGRDPRIPLVMRLTMQKRKLFSLMISMVGYLGVCSCACVTDTHVF